MNIGGGNLGGGVHQVREMISQENPSQMNMGGQGYQVGASHNMNHQVQNQNYYPNQVYNNPQFNV